MKNLSKQDRVVSRTASDVERRYRLSRIVPLEEEMQNKVEKEDGMGLSTNDFTNRQKRKLDYIEEQAQANVIEQINVNGKKQTVTNKIVNLEIVEDNLTGNNTDKAPSQRAVNEKLKMNITELTKDTSKATTSKPVTINLNDSINNYDMIYVSLSGDGNHMDQMVFLPSFLLPSNFNIKSGDAYNVSGHCKFPTDKTFTVTPTSSKGWDGVSISAVLGINFYKK